MKANKTFTTIIIIFCVAFSLNTNNLYSQITVGAATAPKDFSILQLEQVEKERGIRLPRLNQTQCDNLKNAVNGQTPAAGLVVYNTSTNNIQYWNGSSDWIVLDYKKIEIVGENGVKEISRSSGGLQLGGDLNNSTTINLGTHSLYFPITANKQFVVSSANDFVVTSTGNIGIGKSTPDPTVKMDVNKGSETYGLRISNSGEAPDYLLTSDDNGNGTWQPLKPLSSIVSGNIYPDRSFDKTSGSDITISDDLTLSRGKWLIMGKITATRSGVNNMYTYITLRYRDGGSSHTATIVGSLPEQTLYSGSYCYATPQFFYYVELDDPRTFYVTAGSSSSDHSFINKTSSDYGGSYFYALRIDNKN